MMKRFNIEFISTAVLMLMLAVSCCISASGQPAVKQGPPVPVGFCIGANEMELYRMINEYRQLNNLPAIPLSKSLSYVASMHAKDLFLHHPDHGACNFHSWSNRGNWIPFCYPKDETKKNSVWDKPRELTKYPSRAYEIVYWENNPLVTDTVIMVWKTEEYFNNFLLNSGKWQGKNWNAIGIAVYQNYACAWFGEFPDPQGKVIVCGSKPDNPVIDTVKPEIKPPVKPTVKSKKPKTGGTAVLKGDSLTIKPADSLPLRPKTPVSGNPGKTVLSKDSTAGIYYIIVKTSVPLDAAKKMVNELRAGEFPEAVVLEKDDKIRVSVFESSDKPMVMTKLKEVKKTYKDAWLLKR